MTPFRYTQIIPFHLVDGAGILFYAHAFTLAHQAFEASLQQALYLPWQDWFQHPTLIFPIRHAEADYFKPLFAGEPCEMRLHIQTLSASSVHLHCEMHQHGRHCCTVKTVHVCCDRTSKQKVTLPEELRVKLSALLAPSQAIASSVL